MCLYPYQNEDLGELAPLNKKGLVPDAVRRIGTGECWSTRSGYRVFGSIHQTGLDAVLLNMIGGACVKSVTFHLGDCAAAAVSGIETLSYGHVPPVVQL